MGWGQGIVRVCKATECVMVAKFMRKRTNIGVIGNFKLWLRACLPGPAILNGSYQMPPVVEVNSA